MIVGGGVIGRAVAWRCASAGLDVALVSDDIRRAASWAAAGMLAPVTEVHYGEETLLELGLESSRRYPAFVAELEELTGMDVGYRQCGTVVAARDQDDNAALDELYVYQQKLGLEAERLKSRDCRALEPSLSPRVRGGIFVPGDHQIDNRALLDALDEACRRVDAAVHEERVSSVIVRNDRVRGVALGDGTEVSSDHVVVAAGCWSGSLGGLPSGVLPVRPVKGQLLQLKGTESQPLATRNIRGLDVYLVPRLDGRVVVGATVEEKGFDVSPTAGATYALLRDAYELVPGIAELELTEVVAGLRPGSPDNAPLIGETDVGGLLAATGHYRNGVLLTPVTADAIAYVLARGEVPEVVAPFGPRRFVRSAETAP